MKRYKFHSEDIEGADNSPPTVTVYPKSGFSEGGDMPDIVELVDENGYVYLAEVRDYNDSWEVGGTDFLWLELM